MVSLKTENTKNSVAVVFLDCLFYKNPVEEEFDIYNVYLIQE